MKISKQESKLFFLYLILMSPTIVTYLYIFIASMDYALDRAAYISIMDGENFSRLEPILPLISKIFNFFIEGNATIKLIIIQFCFFILLLLTIYKYFLPYNLNIFVKSLTSLILILLTTSLTFGVQLRMGYASILFLYLIISLRKYNFSSYLLLFTPVLMHYGLVFSVLIYFYLHIFKINNRKSFISHSLFLFVPITIFFKNIDKMFSILGIPSYYFGYLDGEIVLGRAIPYTALFYILNVIYLILFNKHMVKDNFYWLSLSGLWLVYIGFFLKFYVAFKMLIPIMMVTIMYTAKNLPSRSNRNIIIYLLFLYLLFPIAFYYLALTTGLEPF